MRASNLVSRPEPARVHDASIWFVLAVALVSLPSAGEGVSNCVPLQLSQNSVSLSA